MIEKGRPKKEEIEEHKGHNSEVFPSRQQKRRV